MCSVTGLASGDKCIVTVTGAQTGAGTYTATAAELSNSNYALPEVTTQSFTVEPKEVTLTWGNTDFVYNGAEQIPELTVGGIAEPIQLRC